MIYMLHEKLINQLAIQHYDLLSFLVNQANRKNTKLT